MVTLTMAILTMAILTMATPTCGVRVCGLRCHSGSSLYIYRVYLLTYLLTYDVAARLVVRSKHRWLLTPPDLQLDSPASMLQPSLVKATRVAELGFL